MDDQPRTLDAGLPGGDVGGKGGVVDRLLAVGVGKDDGRRLAAQLHGRLGQGLPRQAGDDLAGGGAAGQIDLLDDRVFSNAFAGVGAKTGHDVDHAVGEAGPLSELCQLDGRRRRKL